jgi:predicted outer membrane repeat protein
MKYVLIFLFIIFPLINFALIINIPDDQPTIQAGINVAVNGDTVLVQPSIYFENINYNGKNITIGSLFLTTQNTSYISQTVIDGNNLGSVVTFESGEDSTTVLCGFTITNGYAEYGGGIYCIDSGPSVMNVIITNNSAEYGAGIDCHDNSSLSLENVMIVNNSSDWLGGGIFFRDNPNSRLVNVTIMNNTAPGSGGGIHCIGSSPSLENVTITNNSVEYNGGGIYCGYNSCPILENVTIENNISNRYGAGIYCRYYSNPSLENVTIINNSAVWNGGGIYCDWESNPSLENVTIENNVADNGGGIYCEYNSFPNLANVTIMNNSADRRGGGICCWHNSGLVFSSENRCNIYFNNVNNRGSGNDVFSYAPLDVIVDTFTVFNPTDFYASPIEYFSFDILHGLQNQVNSDLYVSPDGNNSNSGLSSEEPLKTIHYACSIIFADSLNPHTIHLSEGTYSSSTTGESFAINLPEHVSLTGENEDTVILDAEGVARVIRCDYVGNVTISNLTINNGYTTIGGGIYCDNSSPILENVTITNNSVEYNGGGICCNNNSNPILKNVIILNNSAESSGGGISCSSNSNPILENVTIANNSANWRGGGIYCWHNSNPIFKNVTVENNTAISGGGIFCKYFSSPNFVNVTITNNLVTENGGGIYCEDSVPILTNVTIADNLADENGGGIYCYYNSSPSLVNCVMWNDYPEEVYLREDYYPNSITISYSDIQGGENGIVTNNNGIVYWLDGNIDEDPLFVGTGEHPYALLEDSPCIDAGIPDTTGLNLPPWDIIGNLRIWDGDNNGSAIIDMGAYEYGAPPYVGIINDQLPMTSYQLSNYPNPFKPSGAGRSPATTISFQLSENGEVNLSVYNIKGQKIKTIVNEKLEQGLHQTIWDGKNDNNRYVASGVYFYELKVNNKNIAIKKCLLLK